VKRSPVRKNKKGVTFAVAPSFWRGCWVARSATQLAREEDDEKVRLRHEIKHYACHFENFFI
jgi:hypothetical protein